MSKHGRQLVLIALAGVLALVSAAAGLGAGTKSSGKPPILIGSIMSITGAIASIGIQEKNGFELAVREANAAGGIKGRKIDWKLYDPALDSAQCVSLTRRLIENDNAPVIVGGGASSGCALAMEQVLTPRKIFFSSPEASPLITDPVTTNPTTFQMTARSTTVVERLLQYAKSKGVTTVGVIGDTGAYGQSGVTAANDLASKYGLTVKSASMSATSSDVTPQLRDLSSSNPGAYILWTALPVGVIAIKGAHDLGLDKKALIMTSHSYANTTFMKQAGEAGKGVYVPVVNATVYKQVLKTLKEPAKGTLQAFANLYKKRFGQDIAIYSAQSYDAMNLAIRALRLTNGNTDGPTLARAIEKAGAFVGVMGTHNFSATDHYGYAPSNIRMARWSGSGWILQKG